MNEPLDREVPLSEFARRICVTAHPHFSTTGSTVPCGPHLQMARQVWGLTQVNGTAALRVIMDVRREGGLPDLTT